MSDMTVLSQRLDKWLWCARFFKSRNLAGKLLAAGRLRLSGKVVSKAHQLVRSGDILTFPQGADIRVVKVTSLAERRGPAQEAQTLYEDLESIRRQRRADPGIIASEPSAARRGGRPTKGDRCAVDRLMRREPGGI